MTTRQLPANGAKDPSRHPDAHRQPAGQPEGSWMLLHGTPLTPEVWVPVAERINADTGSHVHVPTITPVPGARPVNSTLVSAVVNTLGPHEKVHVVGHSFGGQIALDFAAAAPGRVRSLTLLCSRDTPFPPFAATAERLRATGIPDPGPALKRWFTSQELDQNGSVVRYTRSVLQCADPESWALALDSIATYNGPSSPLPAGVPVSIVAAELDPVSTPAAMLDMAGRIHGSHFTMLPGAAHMSPFTNPDALARLLLTGRNS